MNRSMMMSLLWVVTLLISCSEIGQQRVDERGEKIAAYRSANQQGTPIDPAASPLPSGSPSAQIDPAKTVKSIAQSAKVAVNEDTELLLPIQVPNELKENIKVSMRVAPRLGVISANDELRFTYKPNLDVSGNDQVIMIVSWYDGTLLVSESEATIDISIRPVNDFPSAKETNLNIAEDAPTDAQLLASDVDFDTLKYEIIDEPKNGSISDLSSANGKFTYTPKANQTGSDFFKFRVSDPSGAKSEAMVLVKLGEINDRPVANGLRVRGPEDRQLEIQLTGSDVDSPNLQFELMTPPSKGNIPGFMAAGARSNDGKILYTPNDNYNGSDSMMVRAYDGQDFSVAATINITIDAENDAPAIAPVFRIPSSGSPILVNEDIAQNISGNPAVSTVFEAVVADLDNSPSELSFDLVKSPSKGQATGQILNGSLRVSYSPLSNSVGADEMKFRVSDGDKVSIIRTVKLNILNTAPVATASSHQTNEDSRASIDLLGSDPENQSKIFEIVEAPASGMATMVSASEGKVIYTPSANFVGEIQFSFRVRDSGGLVSNSAPVTVVVNPSNDAPIAQNTKVNVGEDQEVEFQLLASDVDTGDILAYSILTPGPQLGSLVPVMGSPGRYKYTPGTNKTGIDAFEFQVEDSSGARAKALCMINLDSDNDAPIAVGQNVSTAEDRSVSFQLIGSDVESTALTYELVQAPVNGSIPGFATVGARTSDGRMTYTPNQNFFGSDSFKFRVFDGQSFSSEATVNIAIDGVNDAPVLSAPSAGSFTVAEDLSSSTPLVVDFNLSDVDSAMASFQFETVTAPTKGNITVSFVSGKLRISYLPRLNQNGSDSLSVRVSDGDKLSATRGFSVSITPVNDAPVTSNQSVSGAPGETISGLIVATDADGDALEFTKRTSPSPRFGNVTVNANGSFTYVPTTNNPSSTSDQFGFRVSDGVLTADAIVTVNFNVQNTPPVAQNATVHAVEDTEKIFSLPVATDAENNSISYAVRSYPTNGTILEFNRITGAVKYMPRANYSGTDTFRYVANDGRADSNEATITINLSAVNDAPVLGISPFTTINEDSVVELALNLSDVETSTGLFAIILQRPSHGTASITGGRLIYTPTANFNGLDRMRLKPSDGIDDGNIYDVVVSVSPVNDAPVAQDLSYNIVEDAVFYGRLRGSDVDGDSIQYSIQGMPPSGVVELTSASSGEFKFTPAFNLNGQTGFTYRVSDGNLYSATKTVTITIAANNPPVAQDLSINGDEDQEIINQQFPVSDSDSVGLEVIIVRSPAFGQIRLDGINFSYLPAANYFGADSFQYLASDGQSVSALKTVSVSIASVNDLPRIILNRELQAVEDTLAEFPFTLSDVENESVNLEILSVVPTDAGNFSIMDSKLRYVPSANFNHNNVIVRLKATDASGGSVEDNFKIIVAPVNDAPTVPAAPVTFVGDEDVDMVIDLPAADVDSSPLRFTLLTQPARGQLIQEGTSGKFAYLPEDNFVGVVQFTYRVSDGELNSADATVNIELRQVNDPPVANGADVSTPEDTDLIVRLSGSDQEGGVLSYTITAQPTQGELNPDPNEPGRYLYKPNLNFFGNDELKFRVSDGQLNSNEATVRIAITPVNDAPIVRSFIQEVQKNQTATRAVEIEDVDDVNFVLTITELPMAGAATVEGTSIRFDAPNQVGVQTVKFRVRDAAGADSNEGTGIFDVKPGAGNEP
jgi:VCBS repeat-containing protein